VALLCLLGTLSALPASAQEAAPGCYGAVHDDPRDGTAVDAASFAMLYDCVQDRQSTWAFDVATHDTWDAAALQAIDLHVDADGSSSSGCDGFEWRAHGFHSAQVDGLVANLFRTPDCGTTHHVKPLEIQQFDRNRVVVLVPNLDLGGPSTLRWFGGLRGAGDSAAERLPESGALTESGYTSQFGDACTTTSQDQWVVPGSAAVAGHVRAAGGSSVAHEGGLVTFSGRRAAVQRRLDAVAPGAVVQPNLPMPPVDAPDDPLLPEQWDLQAVRAGEAWDVTTGSRDVVVGVIDTGFDSTHPELQGALLAGYDVTTGAPLTSRSDPRNHGTAVAGQIAARTGNGAGLASLGRATSVLPVKVLRDGQSVPKVADVSTGIRWAADHGADVINISLGACALAQVLADAVAYAQGKGVLVVASAGNSFQKGNPVQYPASLPGVLAVGALGRDGSHAPYSSTGDYVDLAAPGGRCDEALGGLLVLSSGGGTRRGCGTSLSAPLVAAAAGLLLAHAPDATADQLARALTSSARDLGVPGRDNVYGAGLLDVPRALQAVRRDGLLRPLPPSRLLDTRDGTGGSVGRLAPGSVTTLQVAGRGGVPAAGVGAVLLNTTAVTAAGAGHLTVYPGDAPAPDASSLNHVRGQTVANLVSVPLAPDGTVRLRSSGGSPHAVADVLGYYWRDGTADSRDSGFRALPATRVLDSRDPGGGFGRLAAGSSQSFPVVGRAGVPADATAVVMNVTATGAVAAGHLTVFPGGQDAVPTASTLNYRAGQSVPNLVVVPLGPDGRVSVASGGGSPYVLADVVGYYGPTGGRLTPLVPTRLLDSRTGPPGRLAPERTHRVAVAGRAGVPASGARAVLVNVTVTGPSAAGHLSVFPGGSSVPRTSSLNHVAGQTVPNLVVVPLGADGSLSLRSSAGTPFVLVDVVGWFS
jgi:hypothetical protein